MIIPCHWNSTSVRSLTSCLMSCAACATIWYNITYSLKKWDCKNLLTIPFVFIWSKFHTLLSQPNKCVLNILLSKLWTLMSQSAFPGSVHSLMQWLCHASPPQSGQSHTPVFHWPCCYVSSSCPHTHSLPDCSSLFLMQNSVLDSILPHRLWAFAHGVHFFSGCIFIFSENFCGEPFEPCIKLVSQFIATLCLFWNMYVKS